jgi:hypothetical protein
MYDRLPGLILGYHGCDRSVGEAVLAGKAELKANNNTYDWLGHGIYFWEHNPMRAVQWARAFQRRPKTGRKLAQPHSTLRSKSRVYQGVLSNARGFLSSAESSRKRDIPTRQPTFVESAEVTTHITGSAGHSIVRSRRGMDRGHARARLCSLIKEEAGSYENRVYRNARGEVREE